MIQTLEAPVYLTEQIRELERLAAERLGINSDVLMARAGKAAFDYMQRRFANVKRIAVFCGGGNNGGDGYVLAELAYERGMQVQIFQVGEVSQVAGAAKAARERCQKAGISIAQSNEKTDWHHIDLLVDAICGIGIKDSLREEVVITIERMNRTHVPILAIDIPTGIQADTGIVLGAAVKATATITFIGLKLGLLTGSGLSYCGDLVVNDLQLPLDLYSYVTPAAERVNLSAYQSYLQPRLRDWHKGLSGHVLIVGGAKGYSGATRMAGMAALRVGAGLVSIATDPESAIAMNSTWPELMCHGVANPEALQVLLEKADVVVLGPGLSQSSWAESLWQQVMQSDIKLVVDADGLNLLANQHEIRDQWILTPHPGEAARLLGCSIADVQQDRLEAAKELSRRYGGVAVLKGAGTIIAAANKLPGICDKGNPGMASAGMGDILSGVIGGLLAQGIPYTEAARLGVILHAMAGDMAAKEGERGMIATDLLPFLRRLSNSN